MARTWTGTGMELPVSEDEKRMRLRYSGACRVCSLELPARTEAIYERASKTVRCITHDSASDASPDVSGGVDAGSAGASARRYSAVRRARNRAQMGIARGIVARDERRLPPAHPLPLGDVRGLRRC